jgi:ABC-2 type transport system ATP-binding protein
VALRDALKSRFELDGLVVDRTVRVQADNAHRLIGELVDALGDRIERVTLSHPSLEDVYIQKTGHRFWTENH